MRPRKKRRVCNMPDYESFGPLNKEFKDDPIILTIDEYEVIRLIDLEGLEQKECAERMDVARSTVQRMYKIAKEKMADSLINGRQLKIEGGDYRLCDMDGDFCPECGRGRYRGRQGQGPGGGQGRGPGRGQGMRRGPGPFGR